MLGIVRLFATLVCMAVLVSCAPGSNGMSQEDPEPPLLATGDGESPDDRAPDRASALYHQYQDEFTAARDAFRIAYNTPLVMDTEPEIRMEQVRPGVVVSAEGSVLTRYAQNGVPVRYHWEIYGESGQSHSNYFILADCLYVQRLGITHNTMSYGDGTRLPLQYTLEDYAVTADAVYLLDHIGQRAIPLTEDIDFRTAEELEALFQEGSPL